MPFDYEKLQDRAIYTDSNALTDGIVSGEIVCQDKRLTGATPGKLIHYHKR